MSVGGGESECVVVLLARVAVAGPNGRLEHVAAPAAWRIRLVLLASLPTCSHACSRAPSLGSLPSPIPSPHPPPHPAPPKPTPPPPPPPPPPGG